MLDALLLVAAVANAPARPTEPPPSAELIEFVGEWSDAEAQAFLDRADPGRKTARTPEPAPPTEPEHVR